MTPSLFLPGLRPGRFLSFFRSSRSTALAPAAAPAAFSPEFPAPFEPFADWAHLTGFLSGISEQLPWPSEPEWPLWARELLTSSAYVDMALPEPEGFEDWREWAEVVKGVYGGP